MRVTEQQIKDLWNNGGQIHRGDDYAPITIDDFEGLDIDTDDDGHPTDEMWSVLAEQFNSDIAGEPTSSGGQDFVQKVTAARLERDQLKKDAKAADEEFNDLIREYMLMPRKERPASVTAVADAADMSRERLYQIRDGRR